MIVYIWSLVSMEIVAKSKDSYRSDTYPYRVLPYSELIPVNCKNQDLNRVVAILVYNDIYVHCCGNTAMHFPPF